MQLDPHLGIDLGKAVARRLELGPPHIRRAVDDLALEVAEVDHVEIDDANPSDTGGGQIHRDRRAEPAGADAEHAGSLQLQLPLHADLRQDQMTAVASDLLIGERVRDRGGRHPWLPPATDGMMLTVSPGFTGVSSFSRYRMSSSFT